MTLQSRLLCFTIIVLSAFVHGEEPNDEVDDEYPGSTVTSTRIVDDELYDGMVIAAFSVIFAVFLSFAGVMLGSVSLLEELLMRRYLREGESVQAVVLSAEFARGTTNGTGTCADSTDHQAEYIAHLQYKRVDSSYYTSYVRKHVRVMEKDFSFPKIPKEVKVEFDAGADAEEYSDEAESNEPPRLIELLVLPDFPKSGIPKYQVERRCNCRYQLPTIGTLCCIIGLTWLAIFISFRGYAVLSQDYLHQLGYSAACTVALLVLEIIGVQCFFSRMMHQSMAEEYLEGGDLIVNVDLATISSGEDSFLMP